MFGQRWCLIGSSLSHAIFHRNNHEKWSIIPRQGLLALGLSARMKL